jgi:phenol 2-monooxygenase
MPIPFVRHSEVDVLIIGAGPAGLMCANALANANVNIRIVEQRSVGRSHLFLLLTSLSVRAFKLTTGQGDGISPRTIEVLQVKILPC